MGVSDFVVYVWLFPVAVQIVLPLIILVGSMVIKLPMSLLSREKTINIADQAFVR